MTTRRGTGRDEDRAVLGDLIATPMRERGIREDGRRYWRIRERSTRTTVETGWWTRDELDGAIAIALSTPRTPRAPSGLAGSVGSLLGSWRDAQIRRHEAGDLAERTLTIYRTAVRLWLAAPMAQVLLTRLRRPAVEDQAIAWRAAGMAPRTVDLQIRVLRQAITWGADRGLCREIDVALPVSARDDEHVYCGRTPTRAEVQAVLRAIVPGPRRDGAEILALTGARVGEIVALRVSSVDLAARTLQLSGRDEERGRRGKTRLRLFPVGGRLLELLSGLVRGRTPDERLLQLPRSGDCQIRAELTRASARAGVELVSPHGLRRLVVTELLEVADARTVSELTGHSVSTLLRYYVRPTRSRLAEVVARARLGEALGQVIELPRSGTASGHSGE